MRRFGKRLTAVLLAVLCLAAGAARAAEEPLYRVSADNAARFGTLLSALVRAYEKPAEGDAEAIDAVLAEIRAEDETDGLVADIIADHWRAVYLDPDFSLYLWHAGESEASELEEAGFEDSGTHAFVVLGYKLKDGEMTNELKGRCKAAAAAARSFPSAILVCSGGATGSNNPQRHTEGGLMRDFLVKKCGIDRSRIFCDEKALSTLTNAVNTFRILEAQGIETITLVTSSYHQRWGQMIYHTLAEVNRMRGEYAPSILENFNYDTKPVKTYEHDAQFAANQLASMLGLPSAVVRAMKKSF